MFKKGRKNSSVDSDLDFLENIDFESSEGEFSEENQGNGFEDNIFQNVTVDSNGENRIIIRDNEPRRKVRRRVKKGTKEQVLLKRYNQLLEKEEAEGSDNDIYLGNNHKTERQYKKKEKRPKNEEPVNMQKAVEAYEEQQPNERSEFRENSIDWQDEKYTEFKEAVGDLDDSQRFLSFSPVSIVATIIGIAIFVTAVFSTVSYAKLKASENRASAMERLLSFELAEGDAIAQQVESIEAPVAFEELVEDEVKVLSLVLSSVEKDLKIKLVDNEDTLVKGIRWSAFVTNENDEQTEEFDDDQDGIIHLTDVKAGDYSVEINPESISGDYDIPLEKQVVSVKAKIEYKVIQDIKEEIKTEKEVNAAVEDAQGNQAADVETGPVNVDTVEWCESTRTANGDEYVEATPDISKTVSNKDSNRFLAVLNNLKNSVAVNFSGTVMASKLLPQANTINSIDNNSEAKQEINPFKTETTPENPEPETPEKHECKFTYKSVDDETHITYCTDDCDKGYPMKENHTFDGSGKCTCCGYQKEETGTSHTCKLTYSDPDADTHMTSCTEGCDKGYPMREAHSFDSNGKCNLCGYKRDGSSSDTTDHTHSFKYTSNNDGTHNVKCEAAGCPGGYSEKENCSYENGKCKKCGYTKTEADHVHTFKYSSRGNGTHDATCDCGVTIKKEECDFADGVCKYCGYSKNSEYADDAQLYDASKNALYVKDGDSYRLAKYADYKSGSFSTYYRKTEAFLYTGWQTIDGRRYYFKSDNTYVTGDQIIGGVTYHFASDGALATNSGTLGIDVSKYQPSINWSSVKASGINYVIIRCGYRGSSTGVLIEDPYFKSHIKGAKSVGLKVGVYFFTTAVTEAEAVEEASMCAYLCSGYGIDYPVFIDCEPSGRAGYNGMSASQRTEIIKAFCNTIRSAGYTPGVYANKTWLSEKLNPGALSGAKIWLAQYNSAGPTYTGRYDLWQYTSKGSVNGISGNVDMNQSYLGY